MSIVNNVPPRVLLYSHARTHAAMTHALSVSVTSSCRCGKIHCERALTHRMSCNAPTKRSNNASPSALVRRWRKKWTARSRRRNPRPTRCKRRNLRTFDTHRVRRSKKTAITRAPSNASFGCKRCPLTHWNRPSSSRRNCPNVPNTFAQNAITRPLNQ